jgi:hypothetical protein
MIEIVRTDSDGVRLSTGDELRSARLSEQAATTRAHLLIAFAATAGHEIVKYTDALWSDGQPDLAYVVAAHSSAFAEQALAQAHRRICAWADDNHCAVLPPVSPGNDGWDLAGQRDLYRLVESDPALTSPMPIALLDGSAALSPAPSLLAAFVLTRHTELASSDRNYAPCGYCSLRGCAYRRVERLTSMGKPK